MATLVRQGLILAHQQQQVLRTNWNPGSPTWADTGGRVAGIGGVSREGGQGSEVEWRDRAARLAWIPGPPHYTYLVGLN